MDSSATTQFAARVTMRTVLEALGSEVIEQTHGQFLFAIRTDAATAARIAAFCETALPAFEAWLPVPSEPVEVFVFDTKEALAPFLPAVLGAAAPPAATMGRYDDGRRAIVCSMQWGLGWLGDLLLRAMLAEDWRDGPKRNRWFHPAVESLLYNCFRTPDGRFHGLNVASYYRPQMQRLLTTGKAVPLDKFLRDDYDPKSLEEDQERVQGRELLAWLLSRGQWNAFYRTYRETCATDPSGIAALEAVTGLGIEALATEWERWMMAGDGEIGDSAMAKPFPVLGVLLAREPSEAPGAIVFETCPGGPAARAGVAAGDRIVAVDGAPVANAAALLAILQAGAYGRTTRLLIDRAGARISLGVVLDRYIDG